MGSLLTWILLDTHAFHWWAAEPDRLSQTASAAIEGADGIAIASITWMELAWLAGRERIGIAQPLRTWLTDLSLYAETIHLTPAIAATAASLPRSFPRDPSDRIIYATAIESGLHLVTRDERLLRHPHPRRIAIW